MDGGIPRAVIIVLVTAAVVTPLFAAAATALYYTNREQDTTISELRRQVADLRTVNERLFSELVKSGNAQRATRAETTRLRAQLDAVTRELERVKARLAAARRARDPRPRGTSAPVSRSHFFSARQAVTAARAPGRARGWGR